MNLHTFPALNTAPAIREALGAIRALPKRQCTPLVRQLANGCERNLSHAQSSPKCPAWLYLPATLHDLQAALEHLRMGDVREAVGYLSDSAYRTGTLARVYAGEAQYLPKVPKAR